MLVPPQDQRLARYVNRHFIAIEVVGPRARLVDPDNEARIAGGHFRQVDINACFTGSKPLDRADKFGAGPGTSADHPLGGSPLTVDRGETFYGSQPSRFLKA